MTQRTLAVSDVGRAAYLIANGFEPIEARLLQPGRLLWIFDRSPRLDILSRDFIEARGAAGFLKRFMAARRRLLDDAAGER